MVKKDTQKTETKKIQRVQRPAVARVKKQVAIKEEEKKESAVVEKPVVLAKLKEQPRIFIGKRKSAIAKIFYYAQQPNQFTVDGKKIEERFPFFSWQNIIHAPFAVAQKKINGALEARLSGGGIQSQAEALRLALSRLLLAVYPDAKKSLKDVGYLTRDSRVKERKKYGLKRARRAPQWRKR
ncbi:MAG: 30S ribosomal protein S9 [Parcubacteria group bacterium]|nr:30S ribosomal protein S9 [Parcubacteria group bacterium]